MEVLDAYIRVSQVGDREGDSYRSPDQQISAIRAWAEANGVHVGEVVKDENVSGGKAVKDRKLGRLVARAEECRSAGVITYRLNRFGRNMAETVAAVDRLKKAGARLVSVSPDSFYDTAQPGGQIMLGVLSGLAEQQLDERRENWRASQAEAVAEGKHVGKAPLGYIRRDRVSPEYDAKGKLIRDARLLVDKQYRAIVHEAFEMRARKTSLAKIAATRQRAHRQTHEPIRRESDDREPRVPRRGAWLARRRQARRARGDRGQGAVRRGAARRPLLPEGRLAVVAGAARGAHHLRGLRQAAAHRRARSWRRQARAVLPLHGALRGSRVRRASRRRRRHGGRARAVDSEPGRRARPSARAAMPTRRSSRRVRP